MTKVNHTSIKHITYLDRFQLHKAENSFLVTDGLTGRQMTVLMATAGECDISASQ